MIVSTTHGLFLNFQAIVIFSKLNSVVLAVQEFFNIFSLLTFLPSF